VIESGGANVVSCDESESVLDRVRWRTIVVRGSCSEVASREGRLRFITSRDSRRVLLSSSFDFPKVSNGYATFI